MKPTLTELISRCQDVEEKAKHLVRVPNYGFEDCFRAGAKSQSPIADALRVALEYVPPRGIGAETIQAILEGKV